MPLIQGQEVRRINLNGVTRFSPLPSLWTYSRQPFMSKRKSCESQSLWKQQQGGARLHVWLFVLNATVLLLRNKLQGAVVKFCVCVGLAVKGQKHLSDYAAAQLQRSVQYFRRINSSVKHVGGREGHGGYLHWCSPNLVLFRNLLRTYFILSFRSLKKTLIGFGSNIHL